MPSDLTILATDDFELVARRLELLAKSTAHVALIKAEIDKEYQALLTARKTELSKHERRIDFAEHIILAIAEEHPEWFSDKKTLATPFGSVHAHKTTSHKAADEQHSIRLIETAALRATDEVQRARLLGLIRTHKELNLEAVECLGEKELAALRIVRIQGTSLTIKLAKAGGAKKAPKRKAAPAESEEAAA